jgi:hypothetical protein
MRVLLAFVAILMSLNAWATPPVGTAEITIYPDRSGSFTALVVNDLGPRLVAVSGGILYLEKQPMGYRGFAFRRPFNVTCTATACTDKGSTELNLAITQVPGGFKLKGTLDYVSVEATVTDNEISMSASGGRTNMGYDLTRQRDGLFTGQGDSRAWEGFLMTLNTQGTLAGLKDPATFVVLGISPFVH